MEMKRAARRFDHIARRLLAPIALCVTLAMGAPSHAAGKIGIVFMHGEAGASGRPDRPSQIQIFPRAAKFRQSRAKRIKEKRLGFPWILLSGSSLFSGLR
jgi:hypothetical protein